MAPVGALRLVPQVKEVVWGGGWLVAELGRTGRPGAALGESWEAFAGSVVAGGPLAGHTLGDLFAGRQTELFGTAAARYPRFPLLAKFIDAHANLSVQVHPNDEQAERLEGYPYGKTEFWYVLRATPGAQIVYGLARPGVTRGELREALAGGRLLSLCRSVAVQPGDVIFVPAGTVHALTAGMVVYELQQDSDITYRLYDWGRTGREIHVEKGLEAVDLDRHSLTPSRPVPVKQGNCLRATLAECALFRSELVEVRRECGFAGSGETFTLLSAIDGAGSLVCAGEALPLAKGDTVLVPASPDYALAPGGGGQLTVIASRLAGGAAG